MYLKYPKKRQIHIIARAFNSYPLVNFELYVRIVNSIHS